MWYCSGNRDERVFEDAEDFNILRYNADKHLGYGSGIHRCLGQHVAEMELRLLLEELLDSQMRLELVEPPQRILSNFSANYSKLVVRTVA
jgi:cytochrome P450